jgi:hypothetical protein
MSFADIEQWLLAQIVPVLFVGFALLAGLALVYFSAQSRRAARRRDRAGQDENTFAERLAVYGFDVELARAAYRYLEQRTGVGFPILANDDLERDLGLDREGAMDALRELNAQVGRDYLPGLVQAPLVTVADLLRAVQASPRKVLPMRRKA